MMNDVVSPLLSFTCDLADLVALRRSTGRSPRSLLEVSRSNLESTTISMSYDERTTVFLHSSFVAPSQLLRLC